MKSTLLLVVSFSFASTIVVGQERPANVSQLIEKMAPEREHDFGIVAAGKKATHEFAIKNPFDKPIVFKSVNSSCGCATVKMPQRGIKPGETIGLPIELDTIRFQGERTASITVQFAEKELPEIQFQCRAVVMTFSVSPELVEFADARDKVEIAVKRVGSSYWKVRSASSSDPRVSVELGKKKVDAKIVGYTLVCKWDSAEPIPEGQAFVRLITNDSQHRVVDIPVILKPKVESAPDIIRLFNLGDSCSVILKTQAPAKILTVSYDAELIEIDGHANMKKQVHVFRCTRLADSETKAKETFAEFCFDNSFSTKVKVLLR